MKRSLLLLPLLALTLACATHPPAAVPEPPAHTFKEVAVQELRAHPERYAGLVFEERFTFQRIWWGKERPHGKEQTLDLPTHFTARIVAAPLYMARIEFPAAADPLFEHRRDGTDVRLRVRFLRLHPASQTPVFAFEALLPATKPGSDLDYLHR